MLGAACSALLLRASRRASGLGGLLQRNAGAGAAALHGSAGANAADPEPVALAKLKDSFNDATSVTYLEELEKRYHDDPASVDRTWASFFRSLGERAGAVRGGGESRRESSERRRQSRAEQRGGELSDLTAGARRRVVEAGAALSAAASVSAARRCRCRWKKSSRGGGGGVLRWTGPRVHRHRSSPFPSPPLTGLPRATSHSSARSRRRLPPTDKTQNKKQQTQQQRHSDSGVPGDAIAEAYDRFERGESAVSPLAAAAISNQTIQESMRLVMMVRAYQVNGHFAAKLDPLELEARPRNPELDPASYGFSEADMDRE